MSWPRLSIVAVIAAQWGLAGAAMALCPVTTKLVESQIAVSTIAFNGKVIAVDHGEVTKSAHGYIHGFGQRLTFQVQNSWRGRYGVNTDVHVTVPVTEICFGFGCVFPFKVGDTVLVLSPATLPFSAPMFSDGCWVYQGIAGNGLLILPSIGD